MPIEFNDCNYRWQLEDALKDILDRMEFKTPEDFDSVSEALRADKAERSQFVNKLEQSNQTLLNQAFDYFDLPEDYINVAYVKDNLANFGLEEDDISNLKQVDLQSQCFGAHQKIVKAYFQDKADYFKRLTQEQRVEMIAQKNQAILDKQKAQAATKEVFKKMSAPTPGSENSNNKLFVTELFGGQQRFTEILALLKAEPGFSECVDMLGKIDGVMTDEDGIRWSFELYGCGSDCDKLHFCLTNYDALNLNPEDPTKSIGAKILNQSTATQVIPRGEYQLSCFSIKDILVSRIKQMASCGYFHAYARAHGISMDLIDPVLQKMNRENNVPSRAVLKQQALDLQQQAAQVPQQPEVFDILAQILGAPIQGNQPIQLGNNNPLTQFLGALFPNSTIIPFQFGRQNRNPHPENANRRGPPL